MLRSRDIATCAAAIFVAALLSLPALAGAASGGATAPVVSSGGVASDPGAPFLRVSGGLLLNKKTTVTGRIRDSETGQIVDVQGRVGKADWIKVAAARVRKDGTFAATWQMKQSGRVALRAVARGTASIATAGSGGSSTAPTADAIVHKTSRATWFGPEDNGSQTACGVKLTSTTLGVAHRRLPCGTQVSVAFRGRQLIVPVIDRGPFRAGVDWDLTIAASERLGFTATGIGAIGVVTLRDEPLAVLAKAKR